MKANATPALTNAEILAEAVNQTAEKVIKNKRYAPHNCEVVIQSNKRQCIYLKYKNKRIGSFEITNNNVNFQFEIPQKAY